MSRHTFEVSVVGNKAERKPILQNYLFSKLTNIITCSFVYYHSAKSCNYCAPKINKQCFHLPKKDSKAFRSLSQNISFSGKVVLKDRTQLTALHFRRKIELSENRQQGWQAKNDEKLPLYQSRMELRSFPKFVPFPVCLWRLDPRPRGPWQEPFLIEVSELRAVEFRPNQPHEFLALCPQPSDLSRPTAGTQRDYKTARRRVLSARSRVASRHGTFCHEDDVTELRGRFQKVVFQLEAALNEFSFLFIEWNF